MEFDKWMGGTQWADVTKVDMELKNSYNIFEVRGNTTTITDGYKRIRVYLIYDVKHDRRYYAKLVVDGHLTDLPVERASNAF